MVGPMEFDLDQTDALLSTTRAVRKRLDLERDVPNDVLLECLQLAVQAPTGSNRQGWRWMVVRDPEKKNALAEMYKRVGGAYLAAAAADADQASQTGRVLDSANYLAEHLAEVPVMVIPMIIGRLEDDSTNSAAGLFGSIIPAMWSFQLALRSRGLGSCYTTLHLGAEAEAAELLGIPDTVTQVLLMPVGYYTGDTFSVTPRRAAADITFINQWGNKVADL